MEEVLFKFSCKDKPIFFSIKSSQKYCIYDSKSFNLKKYKTNIEWDSVETEKGSVLPLVTVLL